MKKQKQKTWWDYRLVNTGTKKKPNFLIYRVTYVKDTPINIEPGPAIVVGDSVEEYRKELCRMLSDALLKPVFDPQTMPPERVM